MTLREKLTIAKEKGLTIKLISYLTEINEATIYSFSRGKRNLSKEKGEKVDFVIDKVFNGYDLFN